MNQESTFTIDYSQYKNINYSKCAKFDTLLRKTFHTCPVLMEKKKALEEAARHVPELKKHFRIKYSNRKQNFYKKILSIVKDENDEIYNLVKDILFIYSKKKEELDYIVELSNNLEAYESHREEMRESCMSD